MKLFSRLIVTLGLVLLVLGLALLSMALALGFAIAIGWLMTLFLPFDLFQASLLALIASIVAGTLWYNILGAGPGFGPGPAADYEDEYDEEDDYDRIPSNRFYKNEAGKTWEAWLRYHLANSVYIEFQDSPQPVTPMGDKQQQELAIRLADISLALLKTKSPSTKRVNVNLHTLKRQMEKMGQRPYDDNILTLAAMAINDELVYYHDDILNVIRTKLWNQPYSGEDWETY